jgi:hypothetical protein
VGCDSMVSSISATRVQKDEMGYDRERMLTKKCRSKVHYPRVFTIMTRFPGFWDGILKRAIDLIYSIYLSYKMLDAMSDHGKYALQTMGIFSIPQTMHYCPRSNRYPAHILHINYLNAGLDRLESRRWKNIFKSLIRAFQIIFNADRVLDSEEDDRHSDNESSGEHGPVGGKLRHERDRLGIERGHDSRSGGLDSLVITDIVGRSATRVGESTNVPFVIC